MIEGVRHITNGFYLSMETELSLSGGNISSSILYLNLIMPTFVGTQ